MRLQIRKIGAPSSLVVPSELLASLHLRIGDYVRIVHGPDRSITITACSGDDAAEARSGVGSGPQ
jgi:antitoxin component of MazEF toxin-antitoxin module